MIVFFSVSGHVIVSQVSDEFDSTSDSGRALLLGKQKKPGASFLFSEVSFMFIFVVAKQQINSR